jgi:hypothetical protein
MIGRYASNADRQIFNLFPSQPWISILLDKKNWRDIHSLTVTGAEDVIRRRKEALLVVVLDPGAGLRGNDPMATKYGATCTFVLLNVRAHFVDGE